MSQFFASFAEAPAPSSAPDHAHGDDPPQPISLTVRIINLCAVLVPFAGLIVAIALLWGVAFNWVHLAIMAGMYLLTGIGVTVGYHRLFTHRSFETVTPVRFILAVLGSMAVQGCPLSWAATHRQHHQHSDQDEDPHSPHTHGTSLIGALRGFWHSHMGWLFAGFSDRGLERYIPDLRCDALLCWVSKMFPAWVVLGFALPAALGGLLTMSWTGVFLGFLWGGLVRVFLIHHVTWSINSVCHIWGTRPFRANDHSRNNPVFGILGLGEGWHNNHHAFPTSARHGLRWWELDFSYWFIRGLEVCRLAKAVRVPSPERVASKRA